MASFPGPGSPMMGGGMPGGMPGGSPPMSPGGDPAQMLAGLIRRKGGGKRGKHTKGKRKK